jgi:hypothetical protein
MVKRSRILLLVAVVGILCVNIDGDVSAPRGFGFIPTAEAIVGRPCTPVSVAGVARRTARRCARGAYNC